MHCSKNYYDAPFGFIGSEKKIIVDTGSKVDVYDANAAKDGLLLYSGNGKFLYYDEYNDQTAAIYNGQAYIVETGAKLNWSSAMLSKVSSNNLKFDVLDDGYAYATDIANGILYKVSLDGSKVKTY